MLSLFRSISLREFRIAPFRTLLVIAGIATGVAMITAIAIVNRGVLDHFRRSILSVAGKAELQVVAPGGEYRINASIARSVAAIEGVQTAVAVIDQSMPLVGSEHRIRLFGTDFTNSGVFDAYDLELEGGRDPLELLARPNAALTFRVGPDGVARALRSQLRVLGADGPALLEVAAHLSRSGPLSALGEDFAVVDIWHAQQILGIDDLADRIDVIPAPGADLDSLAAEIQQELGPAFRVVRPLGREAYFNRSIFAYQRTIEGFSLLALLAAIFIVYSTVSTLVTARVKSFGTLQCIGARRRDILVMLALEALLLGLTASLLGAVGGIPLAHQMFGLVATMMGTIYLYNIPTAALTLSWTHVGVAVASGTVATLIASLYPMYRVSRLDALQVLSESHRVDDGHDHGGTRLYLAAAGFALLVLVAVAFEVRFGSVIAGNVASVSWFIAFILVSVPVIGWLARVLALRLERVLGVSGRIASENLVRAAGRSSVAVAALAMSLATTLTLAGILFSFQESLSDYIERFMAADLIVASAHNRGGWLEEPISAGLVGVVAAVPGVAAVDTMRMVPGQRLGDERIAIMALSKGFFELDKYKSWFVAGNPEQVLPQVSAGHGVLVSETLNRLSGVSLGDTLALDAPGGVAHVSVAGIVVDYASDRGSVIMSSEAFAKTWRDARVNRLHVHLEPGSDRTRVATEIRAALPDQRSFKVVELQQLVSYHRSFLASAFGAARVLELLIVMVTLAGVVETLASIAHDRRGEFALIRAAGATDGQIERIVLVEAAVMIACGLALGLVGGTVSAWLWVKFHFTYLLGWILEFHFPWHTALRAMTVGGVVAACAAYWPARAVARVKILDALRYE